MGGGRKCLCLFHILEYWHTAESVKNTEHSTITVLQRFSIIALGKEWSLKRSTSTYTKLSCEIWSWEKGISQKRDYYTIFIEVYLIFYLLLLTMQISWWTNYTDKQSIVFWQKRRYWHKNRFHLKYVIGCRTLESMLLGGIECALREIMSMKNWNHQIRWTITWMNFVWWGYPCANSGVPLLIRNTVSWNTSCLCCIMTSSRTNKPCFVSCCSWHCIGTNGERIAYSVAWYNTSERVHNLATQTLVQLWSYQSCNSTLAVLKQPIKAYTCIVIFRIIMVHTIYLLLAYFP